MAARAEGLKLPHERDERTHETAPDPDPVIVQAQRDLDAGLVDTDMRATPGLDAQRRARLVPSPAPTPTPSGTPHRRQRRGLPPESPA